MSATDVNGTRFHLLLSEEDWTPLPPGMVWREEAGGLSLRPLLRRVTKSDELDAGARRGAGRDRFGNWYALDEQSTAITFLAPEAEDAEPFWPPAEPREPPDRAPGSFAPRPAGPETPEALRGLAVTSHHYLVVGTLSPDGLLVFDLHGGGPPHHLKWPLPFSPVDITPRPTGGAWILDRASGTPRLWMLDRYFRVVGPDRGGGASAASAGPTFQPVTGPAGDGGWPATVDPTLRMAVAVDEPDALAVEALPDDTVLVMAVDGPGSRTALSRYGREGRLGPPLELDELLEREMDALTSSDEPTPEWAGHDLAFVAHPDTPHGVVEGTLFVVGRDGNQAFALALRAEDQALSLTWQAGFFPLRRFGGKGIVAAGHRVHYDLGDRWLPVSEQPKPRFASEASVVTRPFDGRSPLCVWHRLFLDACVPPGTSVKVESRTADDPDLLASAAWDEEPSPYPRSGGAELPGHRAFSERELRRDGTGTWETLFQAAEGRFLQLRLTLRGTGRATPRIRALRVHYPRFSYLGEHLPDLYRHDGTSASFLDRYLANVEGFFTEMEGGIASVQRLFDERTVPSEYLEWLGSWVGALLSPAYSESRRRLFLRHAVELFTQRGTRSGLLRLLLLSLDPCVDDSLFEPSAVSRGVAPLSPESGRWGVRIVEAFQTRHAPGVVFGDSTQPEQPRVTRSDEAWTPRRGAGPLHERFRRFLELRYPDLAALGKAWERTDGFALDDVFLSPVPPAHPVRRADWRTFVGNEIGFTYAEATGDDAEVYRGFLRSRYRRVEALNQQYGSAFPSFDAVSLPGEDDFPASNPRLRDWIQFVSLALPLRHKAHRFTVLVPTRPEESPEEQARKLDLASDVVERERPAHTDFDVRPYWALFRVGAARVGYDTLPGEGSRFAALLLGRGGLGDGYAPPRHPENVPDRVVTGRDRIPPPSAL